MKQTCLFISLFLAMSAGAQDEGYKNERVQKGLKGGFQYVGLTSGFSPVHNEFMISIFDARTVTDQVSAGRILTYNSNKKSGKEFMAGYFANVFLGKYKIKPVVGLKGEIMYIPERKFENSLGLIEKIPDYIGVKTSISPGVSYLASQDFVLMFFAQISYLPVTNRDDILISSVLPRIELAYIF